jgi:hypothetical protein
MAKEKSDQKTKRATARKAPAAKRTTSRKQAVTKAAEASTPEAPEAAAKKRGRESKLGIVVGLLQRQGGATVADLVAATGWIAHSMTGALSRLRKAGNAIEKGKSEGGETTYRIVSAEAPARSRKAAS